MRALDQLSEALRQYSKQAAGQAPTRLADLQPYLKKPIDPAILDRYTLVPASQLVPALQGADPVVLTQKAPVDETWDVRFAYGLETGELADCRVTNRWSLGR